ncbi:MAG: glycosyltransferase family 39 protein [Elusimicrobia bacterium]|nr:glycosyltransferase family 39 protein [Elusimicrobiota bacterium]
MRPARRAVVALLAAGVLLRALLLTRRSLWFDEANTLAVASAPLTDTLRLVRTMEGFPPLHYLLMHFWLPLWSDPLLGLRLFSALCGAAALAALLPLARRLAPGREAFVLALAALSSFWIHAGQDGRTYSLLLLWALLAARLLLDLEARWSWGRAAAYAAVSAAGLYTHNFYLLFLAANAAHALAVVRSGRRRWLAIPVGVGLLYLPWAASLLVQVRNWSAISVLTTPFSFGQLLYLLGNMLCDTGFLGFAHEGLTRVLGLAALAGAAGVWLRRGASEPSRRGADFCLTHVVVPLAAAKALELALGKPVTQTRYLIFVSPFLFLWLAWVCGRLEGAWGRLARAGLLVLFAAGTLAYHAGGALVDPRLGALAESIRSATAADVPVVHLDAFYYTPMRYYYLPERRHYLLDPGGRNLNWGALPGYAAVPGPEAVARFERCVVVDPQRSVFPSRIGLASGRDLVGKERP